MKKNRRIQTPHRRNQALRRKSERPRPDWIKIWALHHLQAFVFSLGQFYRYLITSLLTTSVIGIALALPTGFYLILENARDITSDWDDTFQITAFLQMDVEIENAKRLVEGLNQRADIESARFIDKETALNEYKQTSGNAEAIEALDQNPLPSMILIKPSLSLLENDNEEILIKQLEAFPEIDKAIYDQQWARRLNAIIQIIQRSVSILTVFLAIAVLLIVGSTIRMSIYNRRNEIEIIKLFGATNAFIHRPFLYSGFCYGLLGGVFAWLLVALSIGLIETPINNLASLYASSYKLSGLSANNVFTLIGSGILLGLLGSWIAVQRHLTDLET